MTDETYIYNIMQINLKHWLQIICNLEGSGRLSLDLVNANTFSKLPQGQTLGGADIKDGEIGDDLPDTAGTGQGEGALRKDLGVALLINVLLLVVRLLFKKGVCLCR